MATQVGAEKRFQLGLKPLGSALPADWARWILGWQIAALFYQGKPGQKAVDQTPIGAVSLLQPDDLFRRLWGKFLS